jgi:hypothetical protein
MGKSTISMAIFNSKLLVYQRVLQRWWIPPKKNGIKMAGLQVMKPGGLALESHV